MTRYRILGIGNYISNKWKFYKQKNLITENENAADGLKGVYI